MTFSYLAGAWRHDGDEPVFFWHELDDQRCEVRGVREFRDGTRVRVDERHSAQGVGLAHGPLARPEDIGNSAELVLRNGTREEFEMVWASANWTRS